MAAAKTAKKLIVGVILFVLVAFLAVGFFVDSLAKKGIEAGGTYAMGVPTSLTSADVGLLTGSLTISSLNIANPSGFKTDHFFAMDSGKIAVSLASLMRDTVEVPTLELSGLDLNLEKAEGKANYKVILENLGKAEKGDGTATPEAQQPTKRFIVREIVIRDINVHADVLPVGGEATRVDVPIAEIRLANVGSDSNRAALVSDVIGQILKATLQAAIAKGGNLLPGDLTGELGDALNQLAPLGDMGIQVIGKAGEAATEIGRNVGKAAEEIGEKAGEVGEKAKEAVDDVTKEVGDLFKKKDD